MDYKPFLEVFSNVLHELYFINRSAFKGFLLRRKNVSPHLRKFSRVFEIVNQLLTLHSLYLAPQMNGNASSFRNVN